MAVSSARVPSARLWKERFGTHLKYPLHSLSQLSEVRNVLGLESSMDVSWAISHQSAGCCLQPETNCQSRFAAMVSPEPKNVAVRRKNHPINILKHDLASWDTFCGDQHTKSFCYTVTNCVPRDPAALTTPGLCVSQDRRLTGWKMLRAHQVWMGKSLQIYINKNKSGSGVPAQTWCGTKQVLAETDCRLNRTGTVGEGSEASRCGAKNLRAQKHILCAMLCIAEDELITESPPGITSAWLWMPRHSSKRQRSQRATLVKGPDRDCSPQMSCRETDRRPRANESQAPSPSPLLRCASCGGQHQPWDLGYHSARPSTCKRIVKRKKHQNCSQRDGLRFTAGQCHGQALSQKWIFKP